MIQPASKNRLLSLQAFRAVAAISVVFFHVQLIAERRLGVTFLGEVFTEGRLGVDFFFVLSGFIISYVHADDFGDRSAVPGYLVKRIVRIYPLLVVLTLGKLVLMLMLPQLVGEHELNLSLIVRSLLILPQRPIPILPMAWTLTHELLFYGMFAMGLFLGKTAWRRIQIVWAVCIVVISWAMERTGHPDDISLAARFFFHPHNLQFLMGCLIAERYSQGPTLKKTLRSMLAVAGILAVMKVRFLWDVHGKLPSCLAWGAVFTLLIWVAVNWEVNFGARVSALWQKLGDASYSIYLVNTPIVAALCVIGSRFLPPDGWQMQAWLTAVALISILCGLGCYVLLERPMTRWFRRFVPHSPTGEGDR
jgi:peptidoglycan/LPS O-acetylase OafA/YrhL